MVRLAAEAGRCKAAAFRLARWMEALLPSMLASHVESTVLLMSKTVAKSVGGRVRVAWSSSC